MIGRYMMELSRRFDVPVPEETALTRIRTYLERAGYRPSSPTCVSYQRGSFLGAWYSFSPRSWQAELHLATEPKADGETHVTVALNVNTKGQLVTGKERGFWDTELDGLEAAARSGTTDDGKAAKASRTAALSSVLMLPVLFVDMVLVTELVLLAVFFFVLPQLSQDDTVLLLLLSLGLAVLLVPMIILTAKMGIFVSIRQYLADHFPYRTQDRQQFPGRREDAIGFIHGYKVANVRRLLVEGFSAGELHRLVRYEPVLKPIDEQFRPGDDVHRMADTIIGWGQRQFLFDEILAAAQRANPRMYAVHHPYHAQDGEEPAGRTDYDLGRIAALLEEVFESESLYDFCRERGTLESMWMEISKEDNLSQMIYRVLAYAERRVMLGDLLMELKAAYPEAYERCKPYDYDLNRSEAHSDEGV
jgi:hypothetical protein